MAKRTAYRHTGCAEYLGCGDIAFYKVGDPWIEGDEILAEDVVFPNGNTPESFEPMLCGFCGMWLTPDRDLTAEAV